MGLFSSFQKFAQNLVGAPMSAKIAGTANAALTILTKPIQSLTGRYDSAYAKTEKQGAVSLAAQGVVNTLMVTAPFSSAIRAAVIGTVAKLSPATKLIAGIVAVPAVSYLATNPSMIPEVSALAGAGADIPKEPSLESGIAYVKEHPYFSAAALTAGLATLGFGGLAIANLLSNYSNTKAVKENTEATLDLAPENPVQVQDVQDVQDNPNVGIPGTTINIYQGAEPLPATKTTPSKAVKKKSKTKKKVVKKKPKKKTKKKSIKRRKK